MLIAFPAMLVSPGLSLLEKDGILFLLQLWHKRSSSGVICRMLIKDDGLYGICRQCNDVPRELYQFPPCDTFTSEFTSWMSTVELLLCLMVAGSLHMLGVL